VWDTARTLKEQAAGRVAQTAGEIGERGETFLARQKDRAAGELRNIGRSIRSSAESLQDGPLGEIGAYVEAAADGLERASRYLAEQDWGHLRMDAEKVARRQPAWFLGGMFVGGFAVARFLKATAGEQMPVAVDKDAGQQSSRRRRPASDKKRSRHSKNGARPRAGRQS
jgi:hypothetical protein